MVEPEKLAGTYDRPPAAEGPPPGIDDPSVIALVEQYVVALEEGKSPDRGPLLRQHPELAAELARCLDALEFVHRVAPQLEDRGEDAAGTPSADHAGRLGVLGDFRLVREIGRGGMGVVYEAEQVSLRRRVALKVFPFAALLDRRQLQRFQNEAQAAAALDHPNIVGVHFVGCERGVHYYAMQFIEGRTLAQVIDQLRKEQAAGSGQLSVASCQLSVSVEEQVMGGRQSGSGQQAAGKGTEPTVSVGTSPEPAPPDDSPEPRTLNAEPRTPNPEPRTLTPEPSSPAADTDRQPQAAVSTKGHNRTAEFFRSAAQLGIQAAEALEHAHQTGVVHRDIKPSNLMVEFPLPSPSGRGVGGEGPHLWITDFGLAMTQKDPALTMTGDIVGTLRYMSPEQAFGDRRQMDHRTDIYSLGVTLYELLTLQPAFAGDNRETLVRRLLEDDPPRPRTVSRAIPKDLETIVLKATAKEPQQRYASAQDLADDLKRFLADEPIRARRAGPVLRLKKWTKRHKAVTGVVAAMLVAAAIFATVATVQAYQRDVRLTESATDGLNEVRLAMAQKEFAQAQRRVTEIQAELAAAPKLKAQFGPELEDLLH